jgi:hypothetical protein
MPAESDTRGAKDAVSKAVRSILDKRYPHQYGSFTDHHFFTHDGAAIVLSDMSLTIIFGVLSGLSVSKELLRTVSEFSSRLPLHHVWLSEGADDEHWKIIVGQKVPYAWLTDDTLDNLIDILPETYSAISQNIIERLPENMGTRYWNPREEQLDAAGLVLISEL